MRLIEFWSPYLNEEFPNLLNHPEPYFLSHSMNWFIFGLYYGPIDGTPHDFKTWGV